jgi:hypothetical protein
MAKMIYFASVRGMTYVDSAIMEQLDSRLREGDIEKRKTSPQDGTIGYRIFTRGGFAEVEITRCKPDEVGRLGTQVSISGIESVIGTTASRLKKLVEGLKLY